jgi:transcriptional regulator with XRE-family HTH domain
VLGWKFYDKTVKELRKNQSLTAQELARLVNVKPSLILRIDEMRLRNVPEPLQSRITPALKGKHIDKIP